MRKQFTFYESFLAGIEEMSSDEEKLNAFFAIARYAINDEEPDICNMSPMLKLFWKMVYPTLKSSAKKSEGARKRTEKREELIVPNWSDKGQTYLNQLERERDRDIERDIERERERDIERERERDIERERERERDIERLFCPPKSPPEGEGEGEEKPELEEKCFETFWNVYPKKRSKEQALKAWKKLNPDNNLCAIIVESVCAHVARDASWAKDNGQYIPYPATYLNGHMWEDEIGEKKNTWMMEYIQRPLGENAK